MVKRNTVLCLLAACVVGCGIGGDGRERVVLSGAVSYLGRPVDDGSIVFVPCDGATGSSVAVKVADGRYLVDGQGGVPVGDYRVEILAYRKNAGSGGRQLLAPPPPGGSTDHADAPQQYLPAKFNVKSQLKIKVEAGAKSVTQDFALVE